MKDSEYDIRCLRKAPCVACSSDNPVSKLKHKALVRDYINFYGHGKPISKTQTLQATDLDVLQQHHKFVRNDEDNEESTWEQRVAKRYYDRLLKEYALVDLSRYKQGKLGLRWRTQKEVFAGKGQFVCGSIACDSNYNLSAWEVPFAYKEDGTQKYELVKLRLCKDCSHKLNYRKNKERAKRDRVEARNASSGDNHGITENSDSNIVNLKTPSPGEASTDKKRGRGDEDDGFEQAKVKYSKADTTSSTPAAEASNIWSAPVQLEEEKSRGEDMDAFLSELFV
ncbi:hypothetical protein SeMB42_g03820 [Synchytrium endobioticum]|uniref:Folate-sensitive fragile site protein Fra10Ac1 n=1 Tax=Synchytrium endobioticum TaxID=286115 RepID=A0A507CLL8_9FUNG|nr:hypothetical protein SeLEV6574_g07178 [Synchytrium endobioticum]TPX46098.1 hypothetical protein SeMB42_g03820 [Synchytrium endobioticum]